MYKPVKNTLNLFMKAKQIGEQYLNKITTLAIRRAA